MGDRRCPHARGGVPQTSPRKGVGFQVVPMLVGVFRHVISLGQSPNGTLSPCSWGCSAFSQAQIKSLLTFVPMLVGVFQQPSIF